VTSHLTQYIKSKLNYRKYYKKLPIIISQNLLLSNADFIRFHRSETHKHMSIK
jgi:hypothetical protein